MPIPPYKKVISNLTRDYVKLDPILQFIGKELGTKVSIFLSCQSAASFIHIGSKCWLFNTPTAALSVLSLIIDSTLKGRNSDET